MTGTVNWATVTNTNDLPAECREALAQFEREDISIGRLAKILGVSRWDIDDVLNRLGVPVIEIDDGEVDDEVRSYFRDQRATAVKR